MNKKYEQLQVEDKDAFEEFEKKMQSFKDLVLIEQ